MATPVSVNINPVKHGLCPHGLSPGACPICSGGGGASNKRSERIEHKHKADEWSWSKCYSRGLQMKAEQLNSEQLALQRLLNSRQMTASIDRNNFQLFLSNMAVKFANSLIFDFASKLNNLAGKLSKSMANFATKITNAVMSFAQNLIQTTQNFLNNVIQQTAEITQKFINNIKFQIAGLQDKLAAIFGEIINAKAKSLEQRFKTAKEKFFSFIFSMVDSTVEKAKRIDEDTQNLLKTINETMLYLGDFNNEILKEENKELEREENEYNSAI